MELTLEREKKYAKRKEKYMERKQKYPSAKGGVLTFDTRPQMMRSCRLDFALYRELGMGARDSTTEDE